MKVNDRMASTARSAATVGASLMVVLYVYAASEVELTGHETLRVDRLAHTAADGFALERHGGLLSPGTTALRLDDGVYAFQAVNDVQLRMSADGAVTVVPRPQNKDPWPDPPLAPAVWSGQSAEQWGTHTVVLNAKGFGPAERMPVLTVLRGDERC